MPSAAAPKATLAYRITGLLAFPEKFYVAHDRLARMVSLAMRYIGFVVGNADHQTRRLRRPVHRCTRRARRAIEQGLQVRHGQLPQLQQARSQLRWAVDCPALSKY